MEAERGSGAWRLWTRGLRVAALAPWTLLTLWFAGLLVAVPVAWVVDQGIRSSIAGTDVERTLREGFDPVWYGEFEHDAEGLVATFDPTLSGVGAFLVNLEGWFTGEIFAAHGVLVGAGLVFVLLWIWLLGGALRRVAFPERPLGAGEFFLAGGEWFLRLLRLSLLAAPLYWGVYRLHDLLMARAEEALRDTTTESVAIFRTLLIWALTALLLTAIRSAFGFAKVVLVVDGRRSVLLALLRGIGFAILRAPRVVALEALTLGAGVLALAAYAILAPGASVSSWAGVGWTLLLAQALLMTRLGLKVGLLASQAALYRAESPPEPPTS